MTWLRFIAQRLTERRETQFFIEDLQLNWLPSNRRRWARVGIGVLAGVLVGVLGRAPAGVLEGVL